MKSEPVAMIGGVDDLLTNAERDRLPGSVMGTPTLCARCAVCPVTYEAGFCHRCHAELRRPTRAVPGSEEKQAVLEHRAAAHLPLFVEGDFELDLLVVGDFTARPHLGNLDGD